jgi:hypothetical protein
MEQRSLQGTASTSTSDPVQDARICPPFVKRHHTLNPGRSRTAAPNAEWTLTGPFVWICCAVPRRCAAAEGDAVQNQLELSRMECD